MSFPLYLDENFDISLAVLLQRDGYDAVTARDAGLAGRGVKDEVHQEYAARNGCVLITHDLKSFPRMLDRWRAAGGQHAGVLYSAQKDRQPVHEGLLIAQQRWEAKDLVDLAVWLPLPGELP